MFSFLLGVLCFPARQGCPCVSTAVSGANYKDVSVTLAARWHPGGSGVPTPASKPKYDKNPRSGFLSYAGETRADRLSLLYIPPVAG